MKWSIWPRARVWKKMMTAMARLPCKQTSPSQQPRVNNFGNSRNCYWNMQTRHPAPPYVRNHQRQTDHTGEPIDDLLLTLLHAPLPQGEGRGVHFSRSTLFSSPLFFLQHRNSSSEPIRGNLIYKKTLWRSKIFIS